MKGAMPNREVRLALVGIISVAIVLLFGEVEALVLGFLVDCGGLLDLQGS